MSQLLALMSEVSEELGSRDAAASSAAMPPSPPARLLRRLSHGEEASHATVDLQVVEQPSEEPLQAKLATLSRYLRVVQQGWALHAPPPPAATMATTQPSLQTPPLPPRSCNGGGAGTGDGSLAPVHSGASGGAVASSVAPCDGAGAGRAPPSRCRGCGVPHAQSDAARHALERSGAVPHASSSVPPPLAPSSAASATATSKGISKPTTGSGRIRDCIARS